MIYKQESRCRLLYDGTAESRLADIFQVMDGKSFSKTEAASIVGGRGRLLKLMTAGKIRIEAPNNKPHSKWRCNASDVLRHALVKGRKPRKSKNYEKSNNQRATA